MDGRRGPGIRDSGQFSGARQAAAEWRTVQRRTVEVVELARQGGSVEGRIDAAELPRLAPVLAASGGRIGYRLDGLIDDHGRSAARLHIEGRLGLRCDLCGEPLEWTLDETEEFFFVDDEEQLGSLPISPRHPACESRARPEPQPTGERPFAALASLRRGRTDIQ